jgi:transposase
MKDFNRPVTRNTIGVDLSDRKSSYYIVDPHGDCADEGRIPSTPDAFKKFFASLKPALVALETGTHSRWASRVISECRHEVLVGNARELRPIYQSMNKTDRSDAEKLARLARADRTLLHPIELRSEEAQVDLTLLRARAILVESRTKLILHVRGTVKPYGKRIPQCSAECFHFKASQAIPKSLLPALKPVLYLIAELTASIREYGKKIDRIAKKKYPPALHLQQIPGVGPITALAFVLLVDDPRRFRSSRSVGPYFGLTPRRDDSGDCSPQLRITKAGDTFMRTLLVGAAHYILGPFGRDSDLRRFGEALAQRGGKNAKKRAVVAVARKLAVLLHRLWITGEDYRPLRAPEQPRQIRQRA